MIISIAPGLKSRSFQIQSTDPFRNLADEAMRNIMEAI